MAWGRCVEAEGAPTYWPWRQVLRSLRIDSDTVLDVVSARLDRVSAGCRRLVQAAAIVGRDFSLVLVAATLDEPVAPAARCGSSSVGVEGACRSVLCREARAGAGQVLVPNRLVRPGSLGSSCAATPRAGRLEYESHG
jgi:hypothetical protein